MTETREDGGRRRRLYSITQAGRDALTAWMGPDPGEWMPEVRDIGLLKVFFGADPRTFAAKQAEAHRDKLREYEALEQTLTDTGLPGPLTAPRAGLGHEREWIRYWSELAGEDGG